MCKPMDIYEYLTKNHVGKENAVFSKELEQRFSVSDRALRRMISDLREEGFPVCSGCTGYYLGKSRKEVERTADWLGKMANGIACTGDNVLDICAAQGEPVKIIIWIGGPMEMNDCREQSPEKIDLAERLIRFFEENDTYEKEHALERSKNEEEVLAESLRMLDSGLLMRALLDVMERVCKEETNYLKKNNYERLLTDLESFYDRQIRINRYEEARRHAERNHLHR